ncbi:MAG: Flp pilus assembly protein CpaB [Nitriliruptoraceae bacterium]
MRARLLAGALAIALAIVGTVVLVSYVRNVEARVLEGQQVVHVLVVRDAIDQGTPAEQVGDHVEFEETIARLAVDGAVTDLEEVAGLVTATAMVPGEQLLRSRFVEPEELTAVGGVEVPDGLHQVTVSLDAERSVGGVLRPGDTVGVFASLVASQLDEIGDTTHLILHKVLVTRVQYEQAPPDDPDRFAQTTPTGRVHVTLATSAPDAERIVFTAEHGTLWLSLEPEGAPESGTTVRERESVFR